MQAGEEVSVHHTALPGFAPFPTWNGTLAAASGAHDGRCSLLRDNGDVLLLQYTESDERPLLCVEKVLRTPVAPLPTSFSQCYADNGRVFACARDRHVTMYDARQGFAPLLSAQLRFSVAAIDITYWPYGVHSDTERVYLLVVGTAFGAYLHRFSLSGEPHSENSADTDTDALPLPLLATAYKDTSICAVRFANNSATVALGSVDGRLFVRQLQCRSSTDNDSGQLDAFGAEVVAHVLAAPRVTSLSFAPCDSHLGAATQKGHVYVFTRDSSDTVDLDVWRLHPACRALSSNPKPSATAAATFVCWWGTAHSSALVVASRTANCRLELVDATSGKLVRTVQVASRRQRALGDSDALVTPPSAAGDDLLLGVGCVGVTGADGVSRQRLVCHDTSSSLSVVAWLGLDVWTG